MIVKSKEEQAEEARKTRNFPATYSVDASMESPMAYYTN